ncbi:MAG: TonB family protein [Bacteroidales bacterium]|nr:TonB family protein [Bacteroidales bacterium]
MQGQIINGFELKRLLGRGGMAEVWYAENEIGKPAAVKILNESLSHNQQIVERFHNEALVMVKLDHPNIREVYGYGYLGNRHCIVMEYLEGEDLEALMKGGRRFTDEELQRWWNQTVDALNYTHAMDIVHRDIKPSNLFLDKKGSIKLLDFGIAKVKEGMSMTRTGMTMGTLMYMSPEQVKDPKRVGVKSDVYSLAVTFVHLLTGKPIYDCETSSEYDIQVSIVTEPVDLSSVPTSWRGFLAPYLEKDPQKRPALRNFEAVELKEEPIKTIASEDKETVAEIVRQPESKTIAEPDPRPQPKKAEPLPVEKPQPKPVETKTQSDEPSEGPKNKKGLWLGIGAAAVVLVAVLVVLLTLPKHDSSEPIPSSEVVELPYQLNYSLVTNGELGSRIKERNCMDVFLNEQGGLLINGRPTDIDLLRDAIVEFMTPNPADETAPEIVSCSFDLLGDMLINKGVVVFSKYMDMDTLQPSYDENVAKVINNIAKAFAEMRDGLAYRCFHKNLDQLDSEQFDAVRKAVPAKVVGVGEYVNYKLQIEKKGEEENIGEINNSFIEVCMKKVDDEQGIVAMIDDFSTHTGHNAMRVRKPEEISKKAEQKAEETAYKECTTIQACEAYLKAYPKGKYAKQVKTKKAELEKKEKKQGKENIVINAEVEQNEVIEEYVAPAIVEEKVVEEEIFQIVEEMPSFPGGESKMMEYIGKNIKYPQIARETGIQGRVFVSFVVEPDGSISNVKVLRGIGSGCDEEAVRVVKSMPKWKPGKQRGKAVRVSYQTAIYFRL